MGIARVRERETLYYVPNRGFWWQNLLVFMDLIKIFVLKLLYVCLTLKKGLFVLCACMYVHVFMYFGLNTIKYSKYILCVFFLRSLVLWFSLCLNLWFHGDLGSVDLLWIFYKSLCFYSTLLLFYMFRWYI